jgi:hypothetical protein
MAVFKGIMFQSRQTTTVRTVAKKDFRVLEKQLKKVLEPFGRF